MPSIAQNNALARALKEAGKLTPVTPEENAASKNLQAAPLIPQYPAQPAKYLNAPLPASMWQSPDQQRQFQNPAIPQTRISPLPPNSNPSVGAAAASQAITIVQTAPSTSTGSDVVLTMPVQYDVTTTHTSSEEDINVAWLPVTPGYALMGPGPISALESLVSAGATGSGINQTVVPTSATSWALWVEFSNNNVVSGQPAGWTQLSSTASQNVFYKTQTGTSPYIVSAALSAPATYTAATLVFAGAVPPIVQSSNGTFAGLSGSITMAPVTAGNVIFAVIQGYNGGTVYALSVSDTQGNQYFNVSSSLIGPSSSGPAVSQAVFICPSAVSSGANTVSFSYALLGGSSPPAHQEGFVMETGPLPVGPGTPFFRQIVASDLPSLNDLPGIVPIIKGGTGANLHSTGGASQVVQQTTSGGAFSVGQLSYSDISGNLGSATLTISAPTVGASQVGIGSDTSTSATAGTNGAVPAQVVGYLTINVAGTNMKVPYFHV